MIYLVTGKPGHGKSYYCVRKALDSLEAGKWLATNVELRPGWPEALAKSNPFRRPFAKRIESKAAMFASRSYVTGSLDELVRLRLPGCGTCRNCKAGTRCLTEGRGVMLLDEAHMWLNSRTWDADESGRGLSKAEAVANRLKIIRFFSQHRKLGWTVYLVTQDEGNLDNQVRRNFEYHVHLKNLAKLPIPGIGLRWCPVNVFVAVTTWHDNEKTRLGSSFYLLRKSIAGLYDTMATSHGLEWDAADAIWLGGTAPDVGQAAEPGRRPVPRPTDAGPVPLLPGEVPVPLPGGAG
jgi:hypothetical protein